MKVPKAKPKKGGFLQWMLILFFGAMVVAAGTMVFNNYAAPKISSSLGETPEQQALEQQMAQVTEDEIASCNGVASINLLYDDKDSFKLGTDPATTMTIYDPIAKTVADDATSTTVPIKSTLKALLGNSQGTPSTSYFGKEAVVETVCSDQDFQPELSLAGAPTLTVTNDNGVTLNANATDEAMGADSTYFPEITVKAPANAVSSEYGAIVVFEYDATYIQNIESPDLSPSSRGVFLTHSGNFDQFKVFEYDGVLQNGDRDYIGFEVTTTGSAPGADQGNIKIHWLPINKDLNADTFDLITGLYDEDNNAIYLGNTTTTYYSS